jgi:hypothetical protein
MDILLLVFVVSSLGTARTFFLIKAQIITRVLFYILYILIVMMFRTVPMFYLPEDWFGDILSSFLALPFAPSGSVSVIVWVLVCRKVLRNAMELILGDLDKIPEVEEKGAKDVIPE